MNRYKTSNRFLDRKFPVEEHLEALYYLVKSIENTGLFYFSRPNPFAEIRYHNLLSGGHHGELFRDTAAVILAALPQMPKG